MRKNRQQKAQPKSRPPKTSASTSVSLDKPASHGTHQVSNRKPGLSWAKLRWPVCTVAALAFCGGLKVTADVLHERAEKERAIERAKPKPPAPALCTQVVITELKHPDGSVKGTERAEHKVPCVQKAGVPYKPTEYPMWLKIVGWTLLVLLIILCIWSRTPFVPFLP